MEEDVLKPYPYYETRPVTTLKDVITWPARRTPEKDAFRVRIDRKHYRGISWRQFEDDVNALGTALLSHGLGNAHIGVIGENSYEWVLVYMAVLCGVGVIVPLDRDLPAEKLAEQMQFADAKAVFFSKTYESMMREFSASLSGMELFSNMNGAETFGVTLGALLEEGRALLAKGDRAYLDAQPNTEKMAAILFTSGTSGTSKAVMLSQKNLITSFDCACKHISYTEDDVMLSVLPLHHAYESNCGILAMLHTSTVVCFNENLKYFFDNLKLFRPTGMSLVPMFSETMYKQVVEEAKRAGKYKKLTFGRRLSRFMQRLGLGVPRKLFRDVYEPFGGRFKKAFVGGAALDPQITAFFRDLGIVMLQGYGITECSPLVAVNREKYYNDSSVGPILPCCEVKIDGGEILVRGDNVMLGYYKNEEATREVFSDGWFRTGDLGRLDEKGFLHITGRKKNLIILSNGENISPEELETHLMRIPYVKEAVVYESKGVITAEIFPDMDAAQGQGITDVQAFLRGKADELNTRLPQYKQIQAVKFRDTEFEKTTTKKIKRFVLNK